MKILCVCLGNICRSPTAEEVLRSKLFEKNMGSILVDSAGTSAWHEGQPPDGRSVYHASLRGYKLEGASRQVQLSDFSKFDFILAMDSKNLFDLKKLCPLESEQEKIELVTDYCREHLPEKFSEGVPDPYHKGDLGFELVLDLLEDALEGFIENKFQQKE